MFPAKDLVGLAGIAKQIIHLRGTEIIGVNKYQRLTAARIDPNFIDTAAFPCDLASHDRKGAFDELPHRMALPGRKHEVAGLWLLQHHPHASHIVARMSPIARGIEITDI